jgi:hypothetical protein
MNFPGFKVIYVVVAIVALAAGRVIAADGDTVLNPAKRQDALDKAKKLLAPRDIAPISVDPFHSESFAQIVYGASHTAPVVGVVVVSPKTEHEILRSIAASLKPSGNFVLGGQPTLVFGQKRVKAGSMLTITFEGTEYTLEITAIERTSFTLRLNREEFTRPIK